jgi:hypothetical protein
VLLARGTFSHFPGQFDLDLFSHDLIDDLARSFRREAPGVSDRRGPSLSFRDMLPHSSTALSILWTTSARRGSVTSAWTAVYAFASVPDRALASSVDGQNMSRGRSEEQLPLPETSPRSWIMGLGTNSSFWSR